MVETKLEKSSIFREETSKNLNTVKFTLPNIKEGSILEVKYVTHSNFIFNFQGWIIQHDIPVLESEYLTSVPDLLKYNPHFWGYIDVNVASTDVKKPNFDFFEKITSYTAKDIPAFPDEPFVINKSNYRSRIEFELASTNFSSGYKEYTLTWTTLNNLLLEDDNFGKQLNRSGYFKDEVEPIKSSPLSQLEKINSAYQLIKNRIKWNGVESIYTTGSIKKSFDSRIGNVADINLALVSMLRELDIPAYPVVLSTSDHGIILKTFPTLTKFNYVIAAVLVGDKKMLLDASDPFATTTMLPAKCLNGFGRLVNEEAGSWVDLTASRVFQSLVNYVATIDPEKGLTGHYIEKNYNYAGLKMRTDLKDSIGSKRYLQKLNEKFKDLHFEDPKVSFFNDVNRELVLEAKFSSKSGFETTDELIYFNPIQMERYLENPFKSATRILPIEFDYPWIVNASIEITIPDTYTIESMPKSASYQNAEKSAKFTFIIEVPKPTMIKVNSMIFFNKAKLNSDEYEGIKDFFSHIVAKHAEQIVLRKKT